MDARSHQGRSLGSTGEVQSLSDCHTPCSSERQLLRLRLPLIEPRLRLPVIVVGGFLLIVMFGLPASFHIGEPVILDRSVIDDWIPFLEWTIWIYTSYYLFLILAVWLPRDDRCRSDAVYGILLAGLVALVIFMVLPTSVIPASPNAGGPTGLLWRLLLSVDTTLNALPSLHVADTCLAAAALASGSRLWRIAALVWAVMIILSTLTAKQHYAVDVPAGCLLAAVCSLLVRFGVTYWRIDRKVAV
jgi:membrane-associated phospholipid phosphatase